MSQVTSQYIEVNIQNFQFKTNSWFYPRFKLVKWSHSIIQDLKICANVSLSKLENVLSTVLLLWKSCLFQEGGRGRQATNKELRCHPLKYLTTLSNIWPPCQISSHKRKYLATLSNITSWLLIICSSLSNIRVWSLSGNQWLHLYTFLCGHLCEHADIRSTHILSPEL